MNVKNILCPIDFSLNASSVIELASTLARQNDAELHLVHVYEAPHSHSEGSFGGYVPQAGLEAEKAKLEAIVPNLNPIQFRREFLQGAAADALLHYADQNAIDLIVVGTHGRTGVRRLLMGSVSETLLRKAVCPVITVKLPAAADFTAVPSDPTLPVDTT